MIVIQKAGAEHIEVLIDFQQRLAFESENVSLGIEKLQRV